MVLFRGRYSLHTLSASPHSLRADEVTLTFKSKGGNPFPMTFTPADFKAWVLAGRDVFQMSKEGSRKRGILTLEEAQRVAPPDYLLLATSSDTAADLEGFMRNHASGLEQQATRSIAKSPDFTKEYGPLTALAEGEPIIFYTRNGTVLLEADGLVTNSVCLLFNEAKHSPNSDDVDSLVSRADVLRGLLAKPANVARTSPPGMMEQLAGIKKVVPVLCGFHFVPSVMALCHERGVSPVTTDGDGGNDPAG